jgi:hypothetical protein
MAGMMSEEERQRILAMMMAGQPFRRPPPVQATPATPLPGVPMNVGVVAPQSERAVAAPPPQQYDEMAALRSMIKPREFTPTGNKEVDAILARGSQARQAGAQNVLDILSKARMNPEEEALLNERRARTAKDLERLESDKRQEGWDALARAGFAMAQSNSPYFMQALASGLEAGVKGLDEAKLKREEKRSRLQAADEDIRLAVVRGRQSAQDRALSVYNAALAAGETEERALAAARKAAEEEVTMPQRLEMADLEVKGKKADLRLTEARIVDTLRGPRGGGGGGDGAGPKPASATSVLEETGKFTRDLPELRTKASDAFYAYQKEKDPEKKKELKGKYEIARDNYRRSRDRLAVLENRKPGTPFRRSVRGEVYTGPERKNFTGTNAEWNAMTAAEKKLFQ